MNNICNCGHIRQAHYFGKGYSPCLVHNGTWCSCDEFKLDNLRFLEDVVYQKDSKQHNRDASFQAKKVN